MWSLSWGFSSLNPYTFQPSGIPFSYSSLVRKIGFLSEFYLPESPPPCSMWLGTVLVAQPQERGNNPTITLTPILWGLQGPLLFLWSERWSFYWSFSFLHHHTVLHVGVHTQGKAAGGKREKKGETPPLYSHFHGFESLCNPSACVDARVLRCLFSCFVHRFCWQSTGEGQQWAYSVLARIRTSCFLFSDWSQHCSWQSRAVLNEDPSYSVAQSSYLWSVHFHQCNWGSSREKLIRAVLWRTKSWC